MGHHRPQRPPAGQAAPGGAAGDQPRCLQPPHAPRRHHHREHDVHRLPQDGHLQGTAHPPRKHGRTPGGLGGGKRGQCPEPGRGKGLRSRRGQCPWGERALCWLLQSSSREPAGRNEGWETGWGVQQTLGHADELWSCRETPVAPWSARGWPKGWSRPAPVSVATTRNRPSTPASPRTRPGSTASWPLRTRRGALAEGTAGTCSMPRLAAASTARAPTVPPRCVPGAPTAAHPAAGASPHARREGWATGLARNQGRGSLAPHSRSAGPRWGRIGGHSPQQALLKVPKTLPATAAIK